jgi:hypothetical protein
MTDRHEIPGPGDDDARGGDVPWRGSCPVRWLVDDVGRFLAGDDAPADEIDGTGRRALGQASSDLDELLRSAFGAHEVLATELRLAGPTRGFRRTVFAVTPTPLALMLLCLRLCEPGDDVTVMQHTAGQGTTTRADRWPFGTATAEELTRPPARHAEALPDGLGVD